MARLYFSLLTMALAVIASATTPDNEANNDANPALRERQLSSDTGSSATNLTIGGLGPPAVGSGGVEVYTTIYTISYYSYFAVTGVDTTTIGSKRITTTTEVSITASDSFHAMQSLLSAGDAAQSSASGAAAAATRTLLQPISTSASTTSASTTTPVATSSSTSTRSVSSTSVSRSSTSSAPASTGAAQKGVARIGNQIVLGIAVLLANV